MWIRELEEVYGGMDGSGMGHTTCSFHKCMRDGRGSEVLRRGLAALAKLPVPVGRVLLKRRSSKRTAQEQDGVAEQAGESPGQGDRQRGYTYRHGGR